MKDERLAWWGNCEDCDARVIIAPSLDNKDGLPDTEDWDCFTFADCYVCDGRVIFGGADPWQDLLK